MTSYLRQSTASQSRMIGPFLDASDLSTSEQALVINDTDVKLLKNGAASVNKNLGGATHHVNGLYSLTFNAVDTDTVGELVVSIEVPGARGVAATFQVLSQVVYDAMFADAAPGFASAAVATEARLAELDPANIPADVDALVAAVAALNDVSVADINAQVADVLRVDTLTLPGQEAPPVNPTLAQAILWIFKNFRNRKTQSNNLYALFDDAGSTVDAKSVISEAAGTVEKGEMQAGP